MTRSLLVVAYLISVSALKVTDKSEPSEQPAESEVPDEIDSIDTSPEMIASASKSRDLLQKPKAQLKDGAESTEILLSNGRIVKAGAESKSGRSKAERAALPKFMMTNGPATADSDGFSWASYRWNLDNPGMRTHPAKAKNSHDAQFVVTCCLDSKTAKHFSNLPKRSPDRPYLVKTLNGKKEVQDVLAKRSDIYVLNYDLRDEMDKKSEPLRGITIAPHNYFNGRKVGPNAPRKYFVSFQGRKTSKLRHELHDAFNGKNSKYRFRKDIDVTTVMDRMWNVKQQTGDHHFNEKMNTTYALLPKGDDRWSLRFSEAIGAGAIPVILADGLTLPYENIIDWSTAAIRLPNAYAKDADLIMKALPSDQETIVKMRQAVYDINRKYFATPDARADAMLLDAAALVKKGGKYSPIWNSYTQGEMKD